MALVLLLLLLLILLLLLVLLLLLQPLLIPPPTVPRILSPPLSLACLITSLLAGTLLPTYLQVPTYTPSSYLPSPLTCLPTYLLTLLPSYLHP